MADDFFGFSDPNEPKNYTPPEGYEAVHQDGMTWAKQGATYQTTSRVSPAHWNHLVAQFRGLLTQAGVDVSDLLPGSPLLLREFVKRLVLAVLSGVDIEGYNLLDKATYDPDDDGVIGLAQGGTGVVAADAEGLRDALGITTAIGDAIAALVGSSPGALDTLEELANALADDENFAATVMTALAKRVRVDAAQAFTVAEQAQARANVGVGIPMSKSPPAMSWVSVNEISIAAGKCRSQDDAGDIVLPSPFSIAGISVGNNAHRHVLAGLDGSGLPIAALASTVALPSGWQTYRRVGSILTDGSGNVRQFVQSGDVFLWSASVLSLLATTIGSASANTLAVAVPAGVAVEAILQVSARSTGNFEVRASSKLTNDEAPGTDNHTIRLVVSQTADGQNNIDILTNDGEIRYRRGADDLASGRFVVRTLGYRDRRGRDG